MYEQGSTESNLETVCSKAQKIQLPFLKMLLITYGNYSKYKTIPKPSSYLITNTFDNFQVDNELSCIFCF